MTEETIVDLRSQWQKKVELLSFPTNHINKMPAVVIEKLNNQDQIYLYLDLISQYIAFGLWYDTTFNFCIRILSQISCFFIISHTRKNIMKKKELLKKIEEIEVIQNFEFSRPNNLNHPFLRMYKDVVNDNISNALKNYFLELIKCCCLYESKRDTCRGSAKAAKISLALESFKKSAIEAQSLLNKHLDDNYSKGVLKQSYIRTMLISFKQMINQKKAHSKQQQLTERLLIKKLMLINI